MTKKRKMMEIRSCNECGHFRRNDEDWCSTFREPSCKLSNRDIPNKKAYCTIPDWCQLSDVEFNFLPKELEGHDIYVIKGNGEKFFYILVQTNEKCFRYHVRPMRKGGTPSSIILDDVKYRLVEKPLKDRSDE